MNLRKEPTATNRSIGKFIFEYWIFAISAVFFGGVAIGSLTYYLKTKFNVAVPIAVVANSAPVSSAPTSASASAASGHSDSLVEQKSAEQSEISSAPKEEPLPAIGRFTIERIGSFLTSNYISENFGGHPVIEKVAVKYVDDETIYVYEKNGLFAIARAGDTVVTTPRRESDKVVWDFSLDLGRRAKAAHQ